MPKSYTKKRKGKRTSIAIDPLLTNRIDKILKNKEKLAEFAREAISEKLWDREREAITSLSSTEQFHKIETMKKDIEELKKDHVTAKEIYFLGLQIDAAEKKEERHYKKFQRIVDTRMQTYKEAIKLLKTAKKNPISRKELEKL